jgi:hypothetical protein
MKNALLSLITATLLGPALQPAAQAAVLLDQPLQMSDGRASSVYNGGTQGFMTFDRIQLAQTSLVDRVTWIGAFIDTQNPSNNPVPPAAASWTFQVAQDTAGAPGAVTDSTTIAFAQASAAFLGTAVLAGQPVTLFRFEAALADPLLVDGGTDQWFSVFAEDALTRPGFAWFSGQGGDGLSTQLRPGQSSLGPYTDRAMTLEGFVVPEAPTLALVAAALMAAGLGRRRWSWGEATRLRAVRLSR